MSLDVRWSITLGWHISFSKREYGMQCSGRIPSRTMVPCLPHPAASITFIVLTVPVRHDCVDEAVKAALTSDAWEAPIRRAGWLFYPSPMEKLSAQQINKWHHVEGLPPALTPCYHSPSLCHSSVKNVKEPSWLYWCWVFRIAHTFQTRSVITQRTSCFCSFLYMHKNNMHWTLFVSPMLFCRKHSSCLGIAKTLAFQCICWSQMNLDLLAFFFF